MKAERFRSARPFFETLALLILTLAGGLAVHAQSNPVPLINQPLVPAAAAPGGGAFTLTVNGTGFVSGSSVNWNGSVRATTFVSSSQLTAAISASDVASAGTALVTVSSPAPGGGVSNVVYFEVTTTVSPLVFNSSNYATGQFPTGLTTADFNGDGKLDLAAADDTGGAVSILLGNGDGTFQPHVDYGTGSGSTALAAGDFNGDGKLDLAVVDNNCPALPCASNGLVSILLGNGDGTFRAHVDYTTGGVVPTYITVGDFNRDGNLDLAITNICGNDSSCLNGPGTVAILLGNGDGTFQAPLILSVSTFGDSLVTEDFNNDGNLDLAVAGSVCELRGCAAFVSVLLGNGDGTFRAAVDYPASDGALGLTVADLNGDGKPDLVVANLFASTVSVFLGNGDGTFQSAVDYVTGSNPEAIATGDFNGDGKLDVATVNGTVSILLGNGDGSFQEPVATVQTSIITGAAGDFNGDGRLDIAGAATTINPNSVTVLLQAVEPLAALSPTSFTFPTQLLGTVSAKQNSTLSDTGNQPLNISSIAISGEYGQTNTCGSSLGVGANCTISVAFAPKGKGTLTGNVSIADNAPGSPQTISLTGTATAVKLAPTSLNFGSVKVGKTSTPQAVTLTNVASKSALAIGRVAFTGSNAGSFAETSTCGASVPPGGSCTFSVTFSPTQKGLKNATLDIFDNGGASPQTVTVTGTGT